MKQLSHIEIANTFAALGHPKRMKILELLLKNLPDNLTFGEVQKQTEIPASTLTHHLREMENGNIVIRQPHGAATRLTLNLNYLQDILSGLMSKCCKNTIGNSIDQN